MPPRPRMLISGGIGSGKSTVGGLLRRRGIPVIDADRVGHELLEPGGEAFDPVARRWPEVLVEGRIDRSALGRLVFGDRGQLAELEEITHPLIRRNIEARVEACGAPLVAVEVPLAGDFLGPGWVRVVVDAPEEVRVARLRERGMSTNEIEERTAAQPPREAWLRLADWVVENGGTRAHLERGVSSVLARLESGRPLRLWTYGFAILCLGSFLYLLRLQDLTIAGDPLIYWERMARLFGGNVPYLDFAFEHLPVMLVPLAAAWLAGGFAGRFVYRGVFAVVMTVTLYGVGRGMAGLGRQLGDSGLHFRWLLVAGPLFPLVMLRNDPWVVLLAVLAIGAWLRGGFERGAGWAVAGVLAKGWPVLLGVIAWWEGRRRLAVVIGALSLGGLLAVAVLPGFSSSRAFQGIHTETMAGGILGLWRTAGGQDPSLIQTAGAVYLEAPAMSVWVGPALGFALVVIAVVRLWGRPFEWPGALLVTGTLVVALLMASPLLSTQFVLWPTPFVAVSRHRSTLVLGLLVGLLSLGLISTFATIFTGAAWWFLLVTARNVGLLALGWALTDQARDRSVLI